MGFSPWHRQRESPTLNESGASVAAQLERLWPADTPEVENHTHSYYVYIYIIYIYNYCVYVIYKIDTVYDAQYLLFYHNSFSVFYIYINMYTWTILDWYNDDSKRYMYTDSYMISHIFTAVQQETLISHIQPFVSVCLVIGHDTKSDAINLLQTWGVLGSLCWVPDKGPCWLILQKNHGEEKWQRLL